jgi:hypothetical protein
VRRAVFFHSLTHKLCRAFLKTNFSHQQEQQVDARRPQHLRQKHVFSIQLIAYGGKQKLLRISCATQWKLFSFHFSTERLHFVRVRRTKRAATGNVHRSPLVH